MCAFFVACWSDIGEARRSKHRAPILEPPHDARSVSGILLAEAISGFPNWQDALHVCGGYGVDLSAKWVLTENVKMEAVYNVYTTNDDAG